MGARAKPDEEVYRRAIAFTGVLPSRTAMFEDSVKNLEAAKKLGLHTLLIDGETRKEETGSGKGALPGVDIILPTLTMASVQKLAPHLLGKS